MPYDPEAIRQHFRRAMRRRKLNVSSWSRLAGDPESTLREFLNGKIRAPGLDFLITYAEAGGIPPSELLGEEPKVPDVSASALRAMVEMLEQAERNTLGSADTLEAVKRLARSLI